MAVLSGCFGADQFTRERQELGYLGFRDSRKVVTPDGGWIPTIMPVQKRTVWVISDGEELVALAKHFDAIRLAISGGGNCFIFQHLDMRWFTFCRPKQAQPAGAVISITHRCIAQHLDAQAVHRISEVGIIYINIDGLKAIAQDSGVRCGGDGLVGDGIGRVLSGILLPS